MSWWTTKTHTEDTQKIKKQQLYPRTLLMYMNGANLLKQEKLFREQNLARTHQTDRSSFITFTLAPSPGRYTQQRQVTNASAFASKSERKIKLQQSNDVTIPAPNTYQNIQQLHPRQQVKMCGSAMYRNDRFIDKKTGPQLTTRQIAHLHQIANKGSINYSLIENPIKGGTMPRQGMYSAKQAIVESFAPESASKSNIALPTFDRK
ncbi:Hypothetical_protein [Hexamita inflata]|uniref:Hypothetical_protein n=1 Tax=Hexamita inflata TaxID=28002 RepID=A0AA86P4N6_9EUKA|nr:Hypothetical protein HINF_LOCUS19371 [Hexamita inflata]